jgi:hypothetical protein
MAQRKPTLRDPRPSIFKSTASSTAENTDSETDNQPRIKRTYLLTMEDDAAVDSLVTLEFRKTRRKPEKSEIVSKAIQEYFQRHSGE